MSNLRNGNVTLFSTPCRMSLNLMSPVDFRKGLSHPVKFRGRGHPTPLRVVLSRDSRREKKEKRKDVEITHSCCFNERLIANGSICQLHVKLKREIFVLSFLQ